MVTSPFITQFGELNSTLITDVFDRLKIATAGDRIADIGCGSGLFSLFFKECSTYIGIDILRQPGLSEILDDRHRFVIADAHALPLVEHCIDLLLCVDSYEHYPDPQMAAIEFRRVLKREGSLFLSVPNYSNMAGIVKMIMEKYILKKKDSWAPFDFWKVQELEHFITPGKIKNYFSKAGFSHFTMIGYSKEVLIGIFPWAWHPRMPSFLYRVLDRIFNPISKVLAAIFPMLSLHTFWKISVE